MVGVTPLADAARRLFRWLRQAACRLPRWENGASPQLSEKPLARLKILVANRNKVVLQRRTSRPASHTPPAPARSARRAATSCRLQGCLSFRCVPRSNRAVALATSFLRVTRSLVGAATAQAEARRGTRCGHTRLTTAFIQLLVGYRWSRQTPRHDALMNSPRFPPEAAAPRPRQIT